MKIALITNEFYPDIGGVAQNFNSFCKAFKKKEHRVIIFNESYNGRDIYNILDKKSYKLKDLKQIFGNKTLFRYFYTIFWKILTDKRFNFSNRLKMILYLILKPEILIRLIKNVSIIYPYLKTFNVDIIFGNTCGASVLTLIYVLSLLLKKKNIVFAHGNDFLVRSKWSLKTYFIKAIDKIILSNNSMRKTIKNIHHLNDNQLEIIHYGLITEDYDINTSKENLRLKYDIPIDNFVMISVGRHVPRKKFDLVIQAMDQIKKRDPKVKLRYYLIGEGPYTPFLKRLTKKLNLNNDVEFLGAFGGLKKNELIKSSDLFLMPSIAFKESIEGFGIVFLEANYYKVPVIGAYSGGMVEAVINNETGFLIDPNNLEDLVEKILFFYNHEEIRIEMGEKGYKRVLNEFIWEKIVEDYITLFQKLVK